ncbi:hypothetical protein KI387_019932, partial [Taxus chinensis]
RSKGFVEEVGTYKFGFYEFFNKYYPDIIGPEYAAKYITFIYLVGSPSAKFITDIAIYPLEAVKAEYRRNQDFLEDCQL